MSLKEKTASGLTWSFINTVSKFGLTFVISIVLARLLEPKDYGLIGMVTIFVMIARVFIDGGFSDALIRKKEPTKEDYSSVFFFNIILAISFYIILFLSADFISEFFKEPKLILIVRVIGLNLIIGSVASIQNIRLKKEINFKLLTKIGIISSIVSGIISIGMAFNGFGVWSLVFSGLISGFISSVLLWWWGDWMPVMVFSFRSIKNMFSFGSKIMIGSFINVIYNNIYYVLIGRLFSATALGYYTKADQFQKLVSQNIDIVFRQVTYPVLAKIQDEKERLKTNYRSLIKLVSFITFILLLGLAAVSKAMIITLIGEKWLPSVTYLQLLCFVGAFLPLITINVNLLVVKGRSDLSLLFMILKVVFTIPVLLMGYYLGITIMILGMIGVSIIIYLIVLFFVRNLIQYSINEQLRDIWPSFKIAMLVSLPVFVIGNTINITSPLKLLLQLISGLVLLLVLGAVLKNQEYILIKEYIFGIIKKSSK